MTKDWLHSKLLIKDLGRLHYFLGIAVSRGTNGVLMNQHKYILVLLEDIGCSLLKAAETPLDTSTKLELQMEKSLKIKGSIEGLLVSSST